MTEEKSDRAHRTAMEGMIWNANHVLESALKPGIRGIPKELFEMSAGICILSVASAGFIFSGAVGTGIFTVKNDDGSWSNPVACGLTGVGFGFVFGLESKDLILFLPDKNAVKTFFSHGVKVAGKMDLTLLFGRTMEGAGQASRTGFTDVLAIGFTKGAFVSVSLEGAVVGPRDKVNNHFYGEKVSAKDIVEPGKIKFPDGKVTLWPDVLDKLAKLAGGVIVEPTPEETEKKTAAMVAANEAAEDFHKTDEEIIVVAEEEAAKEPVVAEAATEPVVAEAATEPVVAEAATESEAAEAPKEPVAAEAATEPVVAEAATEPVAAEAATEPVAAEAPKEPEAKEPEAPKDP